MIGRYVETYMKLWYARKPTIAAVQGWCIGGGTDMVLCADIIIAGEGATFGYPPSRVWGTPTTAMWVYRMGLEKAKRYMLTGDEIPAKTAADIGLILEAVPDERLQEHSMAFAKRMAMVPANQLMMLKLLCNQTVENMGMASSRQLGILFDGIARHTQEGLDFVERANEVGFRQAVRERDDPFGDYGSRGTRGQVTGDRGQDGRKGVAEALLRFAAAAAAAPLQAESVNADFTTNPEANALLRDDPFAFLIAVLFDQGIRAERAWLAPYLLRARLGHLNPAKMVGDEDGIRSAIETSPKLHRFVGKMSRWLVEAARIVVTDYAGDAGAIWSSSPDADVLQQRLEAFPGIGQKKAAMAVEILERELGVSIGHMERSDIAYDVHVRRVFLRSHLAEWDDRNHMIEVARALHPAQPSALDYPAWFIGKTWCRPRRPDCGNCPIGEVCPKEIARAEFVTGA